MKTTKNKYEVEDDKEEEKDEQIDVTMSDFGSLTILEKRYQEKRC